MIEICLFEATMALGTMAMAKACRRLGGLLKKSISWNLISVIALKSHLILESTMKRGSLFLHSVVCLLVIKRILKWSRVSVGAQARGFLY